MLRDAVITEAVCEKCGAVWVPRKGKLPAVCPECKSRNWNGAEGSSAINLKNIAPPTEEKLDLPPQMEEVQEEPPMPDIGSEPDEDEDFVDSYIVYDEGVGSEEV